MESPYYIYGERKSHRLVRQPSLREPEKAAMDAVALTLPPLPVIVGATMVTPAHPDYNTYLPLHNKRNNLHPALRIICTSTQAVADSVNWIRNNGLSFALRSGGHCYEGFSQSDGVVIDVRKMGLVTVDAANQSVAVSAGASLEKVYRAVAAAGFGFAAGSCPTVGIAGHTLGGGMGLLGRRFGLCCDNLVSVRFVKADGTVVEADANNEPDIYWACRGGGGGSFGVATRFKFTIHPLSTVKTFRVVWTFANVPAALSKAKSVFDAWQKWAPNAPDSITSILTVQKISGNRLMLRCIGQSTGTRTALRGELAKLTIAAAPDAAPSVVNRSFIHAVEAFAGSFDYESIFMDAKSNFVFSPLSTPAISTLFNSILAIPAGNVAALCDAYGGAIAHISATDTAFPNRAQGTFAIQYYARWSNAADSAVRLARLSQVYASMQPFMQGAAYVNYCDLDLGPSYASAYWGANAARLHQIKAALDPANLFHHGQSVQ